jgi:hypothetical protein
MRITDFTRFLPAKQPKPDPVPGIYRADNYEYTKNIQDLPGTDEYTIRLPYKTKKSAPKSGFHDLILGT